MEKLDQDDIKEILTKYKIVAIIGLSRDPSKDSYRVGKYLKNHGFQIIPINPTADEILGEKSYKSLLDIPVETQKTIEVVDIFRPSAEVMPIVEQAIQLKNQHGVLQVVWMQLRIVNEQAAEKARKASLTVIMDKCMMQQHKRIFS
ncbi:CoA-binding protein [Candidatus Bathyarchaeota archaeon]|nr:CoA-binding protein [Candidatus Bathyarchaeota archaeon]